MTMLCPHCKRPISPQNGEQLMQEIARVGAHDVGVYLTNKGGYAIGRGGGEVTWLAIEDALTKGLLQLRWPERPDLKWWVPHS